MIKLIIVLCFTAVCTSEKCFKQDHRTSIYDRNIEYAEIVCSQVAPNLIITSIHFTEKNYPLDVIITDSVIPTISNYSSLLNMKHIRSLRLSGLGIKHIQNGAFRKMKHLEILDLSNNELSEISDGVFQGLENLEELYLTNNKISTNPKLSELKRLKKVDIVDNPVHI